MRSRDLVGAIAAHGLIGSRHELPDEPPSDEEFDFLLRQLESQRLIGLAASASSVGRLALTDGQRERLLAAHTDAMCTCLHLEASLLDVKAAFDEVGIATRVLKGPSSAHLDYADPSLRAFGDLDLLVRSQDVDQARAVLERLGFARSAPEFRPGFDRRFGKGATLIAVDGTNVDLHRTFVMGPLGLRVGLDELWADGEAFTIGGAAVHALAPLHRLLAACYNAIAGDRSPRLSTLRDIAQLILSGDVDADLAVDTAGRWGAEHVLALGVEAAWARLQIADVVGLSAWASRYETDDVDRRLLRLYHDDGAGYSGLSWATARMLPVGQRVAFLSALAFPKGGRLGELGWGVGQRVRRAVRGYSRASM